MSIRKVDSIHSYKEEETEEADEGIEENVKKEMEDALYMNILRDIRDMNVLSSYQLHYLKSISADKLIYLIGVYNRIIRNVNELL